MMYHVIAATMTNADINKRIRELNSILMTDCNFDAWMKVYNKRSVLVNVLNKRGKKENLAPTNAYHVDAYYRKHIKGKSREEINPDNWNFYSDWHQYVYGFRPRAI